MPFNDYSQYGCGAQTCLRQFHVDLENEILHVIIRNVSSYVFAFGKFQVVKAYCENQSRPWRFRRIQVNIYHVVIYSS